MSEPLTGQAASAVLHYESLCLDERRWDDWLALYEDDAVYWVPAWKNENETTTDPDRELSLIYYQGRGGLEDRIWRLKSGLSVASNPLRRTSHMLGNILIAGQSAGGDEVVKASGVVHVYDPRRKAVTVFFGLYEYRLRSVGGEWKIAAKTVRLLNDNIPAVLDVYML